MEKSSVETERIEIEAVPSQHQEAPCADVRISKEEIILLLKKHGVTETKIVENPEIGAEDVIPTLRKAKVKVPDRLFGDLAVVFSLSFMAQATTSELASYATLVVGTLTT